MFERRVEIPHQSSLYDMLFSIGHKLQDEFMLDDEDLTRIIDSSTDEFMQDIRDSRGGWDDMKDWMDQRWPDGWSDDRGSRYELLPLHIAYAAIGFGAEAEDISYFWREELNPFLSRVFSQFEMLVAPQEISLRSKGWRWKRDLDGWSEYLTVPTDLLQIDPESFKGWEIIIHSAPRDFVINLHYV